MSNHTYQWAPIGAHSPTAAAAASLAADGLDPELALRLAPIATGVDDIDHATPVNPTWPGIRIVDDDTPPARPLPAPAFVLELHGLATTEGGTE